MFEKSVWIAHSFGHNAPWYGKPFENEDCGGFGKLPEYGHREYGSLIFRREFTLESEPESAVMNICGLGFYELYINGKKPDENRVLTPRESDYSRYVHYDSYSVEKLLKKGGNIIYAEVCGGWFTGRDKFWGWQQIFFGNPRLCVQLDYTLSDNTSGSITTDTENWDVRKGNITFSDIYDGETTDLNILPYDWYQSSCIPDGWSRPVVSEPPCKKLTENISPPVRITKRYSPVSVRKISDTCYIYDFGINGTGVPCLKVSGRKNDTVKLNFSEFINADGTLNERSCQGGNALNTDVFTLSGRKSEVLQPKFTWHGYRYSMVTLSSPEISMEKAEKLELHSDIETTGFFECGNEEINRYHRACMQTQISCLIGGPLDCNQRGERKGWTGDAGITCEEAIYNFDMEKLYEAFLWELREERHPERKTVGIICPNHKSYFDGTSIDWGLSYPVILEKSFERYGNIGLIDDHWQSVKEYVGFYNSMRDNEGLLPKYMKKDGSDEETAVCWFGDWFTEDKPGGQKKVTFDIGPDDHRQNPGFLCNVFYIWMLRLAVEFAEILGKAEEAGYYSGLRNQTVKALRKKYYDGKSHKFGSGGQFLQTIALSEHIVPEEDRDDVFNELIKCFEETGYHSYMGIYGVRLTGDVMRSFGREDIWYRILTAEGYPGMLNMVADGQTTIAESLSGGGGDDSGSGCHPMFASPDAELYKILAGININRTKEKAVYIHPYCPGNLNYVKASQKIYEGTVEVKWFRKKDGLIQYIISIPTGVTAEIQLDGVHDDIRRTVSAGTYEYLL